MTIDAWVTAIVAIFGALGVRELIPAIGRFLAGGADREKVRVRELIHDRDTAEQRAKAANARAEHEETHRRIMSEYASALRRDLIDLGVEPGDLPPWPT